MASEPEALAEEEYQNYQLRRRVEDLRLNLEICQGERNRYKEKADKLMEPLSGLWFLIFPYAGGGFGLAVGRADPIGELITSAILVVGLVGLFARSARLREDESLSAALVLPVTLGLAPCMFGFIAGVFVFGPL